jgi:soluble lytic murein transglycosylase-like protein/TolA-binding protein
MKLQKRVERMGFGQRRSIVTLACVLLCGALICAAHAQGADDSALSSVRRADSISRGKNGKFEEVSPAEHLRRAGVYMANRLFAAAREHWQALISESPGDPNVPAALLGMARSYFVERRYEEARQTYERVARQYPDTKEGREGLNFAGSSLLRMSRSLEAADRYREYIDKYPDGERIDTAHLNIIDCYREAGRSREAIDWIKRTREKFAGTVTDTGALFALLRLQIADGDWKRALQAADELLGKPFQKGVNTTPDEVAYLKAYSLERAGRGQDAIRAYGAIPANFDSYYGGLATRKLSAMSDASARELAATREQRVREQIAGVADDFPVPYRLEILRQSKPRALDPRLVLAIMMQESRFKPRAKSLSAARGLLQLTIDAAERYGKRSGVKNVTEESLYQPATSIAIGCEYLSQLSRMFANLPEAVAAGYNGGEDNVARWLVRSKQRDDGVFTADIGFPESKTYVFKVMANYRAYQQLYDANLKRR